MANAEGTNQFGGFAKRPSHGEMTKTQGLARAVPTPAVTAPDRARSQATKSARASVPLDSPPPQTPPSYQAQLQVIYEQLLALAPDDPYLAFYAGRG